MREAQEFLLTKTITLTGNRSESALLSQLRFSRQNHCDKEGYLKQGLTLTCKKIKNKVWKKKQKKAEEVQMNKLDLFLKGKTKSFQKQLL